MLRGYEPEALEILKQKKNGKYNVIQIDPSYVPAPIEHKQVFGVTFEQGRNNLKIDKDLLSNVVTENKEIPDSAKIDLLISLNHLKVHTVQLRMLCEGRTGHRYRRRSAVPCPLYTSCGSEGRQLVSPSGSAGIKLPFIDKIKRADRDNAIDVYIGDEYMDVLADGEWQKVFTEKPPVFTKEEKRAWLDKMQDVALGSDAFFPFGDNIERAYKSGVSISRSRADLSVTTT